MTIYVLVSETSPVHLWGLSSTRRLQRQLAEITKEAPFRDANIQWLQDNAELPKDGEVLLLNGNFLFETRTLKGLLEQQNVLLHHDSGAIAAAHVGADHASRAFEIFTVARSGSISELTSLTTADMAAFDENLRRSTRPMLEPVTPERRQELENTLYGNAYRGITDLVTKFVFPKPAKKAVHLCATMGLSPNMVTTIGLLLVVAACYLFLHGYYAAGLLAGWIMTFLDTVDGKLARVTIQSSKFGHLYDHIIDLLHPPFWYIYWGMSLIAFEPLLGQDQQQMYWIIVIAYVVGRLVEGVFSLLGDCSIFTWRPFDAWFRLVTARRNPCLILLTVSWAIGRPDWGFIAVTLWTALTTAIMLLRLVQAGIVRMTGGPLHSWLSEEGVADGSHARSYAIFGATRGAYARH